MTTPAKKKPAKRAPAKKAAAAPARARKPRAEHHDQPPASEETRDAQPVPADDQPEDPQAGSQALEAVAEEMFAREYLVDLNATRAYMRVHPKAKRSTASVEGARTLAKPRVSQRVAFLAHERAQRLEIDGDNLLRQADAIANADHRLLSEYRYLCCRYCHGEGHKYQRTVAEMEKDRDTHAREEREREMKAMLADKDYEPHAFDEKGGSGFNSWLDPHPECPNCHGMGVGTTVINDTRKLPKDAVALYAGMKETKDGIEIKTYDKQKAQDMLFRHKGLYEKDNSQRAQAISPEALARMAAAMDAARARQLDALQERRNEGFPGD